MIYKKIQQKSKGFFYFCLMLWFIFAYQLLLNMIPDAVHIENGDLRQLEFHMPVSFSCEDTGSEVIDTSSVLKAKKNGNMQAEIEYGADADVFLTAKLFGVIPIKSVQAEVVEAKSLHVSGQNIGIYVQADGVMVIGTGNFEGKDDTVYAPAQNILKSGDYICSVNETTVTTKEELVEAVSACDGHQVILGVRRKQEQIDLYLQPVLAKDNTYKLGIWVRDDLAGIGTLSYIEENGNYGALGHSVTDIDTGSRIEVKEGKLYNSTIIGITKGENGKPGELSGVINYNDRYCMGSVDENSENGIFGKLREENNLLENCRTYQTGYKQDITTAPAEILCDLDGEIKSYTINITDINYHKDKTNKSILFDVTDETLLEMTGGIVQGMSGSPIIQDGKMIGAVTHVFVQDSAKGYGIFVEDMLEH